MCIFRLHSWPSRANKSFPYHVKTNHIGIASDDDNGADYPRHPYEPSHQQNDATIIPLSKRTEDFINKGIQNPGFIHDVRYLRNNGPLSIPQQCYPSKSIHHRLPSPTNGPPAFINSKLYGNDTLNEDEDDDSNLDTESGFTKQDSTETIEKRMSNSDFGVRNDDSRQSSQDNDSGHLSLEASNSPNSTTPPDRSLKSPPPLVSILKENPFKIISNKAPNKIILDPIKLPIATTSDISTSNVPRHLFAVKKN
jgi:hypothetical protein